MNSKILAFRLSGIIFGIVALLHLLRIITRVSVIIDGCEIPTWVNWTGFTGAAFLSAWLWSLSLKK